VNENYGFRTTKVFIELREVATGLGLEVKLGTNQFELWRQDKNLTSSLDIDDIGRYMDAYTEGQNSARAKDE
jgi:hypothetical protein